MVHVRYNEKQANPNPYINFTTTLPTKDKADEEAALELLRALAAQVKPIMKTHGFTVNSLEEYEFNQVFAGRNWEAGEVVELVLRRPDGTFFPMSYLLNTLCHELAHIKHMNHLAPFQALWAELRREVLALQARGYFGDGYWSAGHRVGDGTRVDSRPLLSSDLPEYTCGGAQQKSRPRELPRRRREARQAAGRSQHTGRQTEKKRKAGGRVRREAFDDRGKRLDGRSEGDKGEGSTFRKRAASQKAKEERAAAAEKRLRTLQGHTSVQESESEGSESESDDDSRRRNMADTMLRTEMDSLRTADSRGGGSNSKSRSRVVVDLTGNTDDEDDLPDVSDMLKGDFVSMSSGVHVNDKPGDNGKAKFEQTRSRPRASPSSPPPSKRPRLTPSNGDTRPTGSKPKQTVITTFGKDEIKQRTGEAIGLDGSRRLGGNAGAKDAQPWSCLVCTFANASRTSACAMCETAKGNDSWAGDGA